ncbi:Carboxylic ester hydrolase [Mycena venus]|uniref:Carboxylic ester hydrolase n=1 Tax=Mycena venus TaxID=2733690 RepID=A0A8H6XZG3_9AGAR|nr:Carboxylic ester hydrolase [Mycena venus]
MLAYTTLIFASVAATAAAGQSLSPKVAALGYATYQSTLSPDPGVTSFLGIRYAAPPTGQFRWKAPQPPATIKGIQNATQPALQCFQSGSLTGSAGAAITNRFRKSPAFPSGDHNRGKRLQTRDTDGFSDEDCLFLNVHTPTASTADSRLPVIVYMHGGGYDAGNISLYPTQDFVSLSRLGVVAVSIQYRLGVFGFLAGEDVKQGGDLNAGLLDQNFGLQWVQKYISVFGGDPAKVTIWGQSAGAGSILQHIVAHGGNTRPALFRAALANSPFLPFQYQYNDPIPETLYSNVVAHVNCSQSSNSLQCLRSAAASALTDADTQIGFASFMGTYTFVPVVDGTFIVERPSVTLNRGQRNGDALLVTTNSNEGAFFFVFPDVLTVNNFTLTEYITQLFPRLTTQQINIAVGLYSNIGLATVSDQATKIMGESIFVCPAYWMVKAFGKSGWKGEFAIPPGLHAEDLSYEFMTFAIPPTFTDPGFLNAYRQSFLSTAISLNPNDQLKPTLLQTWPSWTGHDVEMLFNQTEGGAPVVETISTDKELLQRCA